MENINWENAINTRRSTRNFEMREVDDETMQHLKNFVTEMRVPFTHDVKIRFFKTIPDKKLFNNLKNAPPDAMAFIADTDILSVSKAGFVGEMAILYATSLGLATCWFGHYLLNELEQVMPHLGEYAVMPMPSFGYGTGVVQGERAICVSPIGYWQREGIRLLDRLTYSANSYKRKPIDRLFADNIKIESLPPEILYALDLARKAPSAANSQFWRFAVSPDFKTISIAMPVGYKHFKWEHPNVDIGICACHFWLGLSLKKIDCKVSLIEENERAVWYFKL